MKFKIKGTLAKGKGVFTEKDLKKGEVVLTMSGDRLTSNQIDVRIDAGLETCDDPLQISRRMYIDLHELPRSINHSCEPNCGIRQTNQLYALRDIKAGEELSFDYSTTVPRYKRWWKMRCHCQSTHCRKVISSFDTIPKKQRDYYLKLHVLPLWVRKYSYYHD